MKAESTELEQRVADARRAGTPADSEAAMNLAEAHRQLFIRWFHDCDHEMRRAVADLCFDSPLFRGYWENVAPGLAEFVHDAVHANADRATPIA